MLDAGEIEIEAVCAHFVGNKLRQEGTMLSEAPIPLRKEFLGPLANYFFNHFKNSDRLYKLTHPVGASQNAIQAVCSPVFAGKPLFEESVKVAAHLYDVSDHPRINSGILYIAKFKNLKFEGKRADAIGYFKADHPDQFLNVDFTKGKAQLSVNTGTRVKSFDKGALVVNRNSLDGYRVVQAVSQNEDASYWVDKFLKLAPVTNDSDHTKQALQICREYGNSLSDADDPNKSVRFLEASYAYFVNQKEFSEDGFSDSLPDDVRESFSHYKVEYEKKHNQVLPSKFSVAAAVLKKQKRSFRSVIRLDGHVEIKIDPSVESLQDELIEKGYDRKRSKGFYKIYYNQES